MPSNPSRDILAKKRVQSVLRKHGIASMRTLENKISDAGPYPQRIDPHVLQNAITALEQEGIITIETFDGKTLQWIHLTSKPLDALQTRLKEQQHVHRKFESGGLNQRIGQTLEIAVFRALKGSPFTFLGNYPDLDDHDDSSFYTKEEPPASISGKTLPDKRRLDFILIDSNGKPIGIETKNHREWVYPGHDIVRELLLKCVILDAVPVLIARRIQYLTFRLITSIGGVVHENFNQLYPESSRTFAERAKDKNLLGYHDLRIGNQPDERLIKFIQVNLPKILPERRAKFDTFKDLTAEYANKRMGYANFIREVSKRSSIPIEYFSDEIDF